MGRGGGLNRRTFFKALPVVVGAVTFVKVPDDTKVFSLREMSGKNVVGWEGIDRSPSTNEFWSPPYRQDKRMEEQLRGLMGLIAKS